MKPNKIEILLGSAVYTGFIPFASGTFGSLVGLAAYLIPGFEQLHIILPAIFIFSIWGMRIGDKFETVYGKDPAECTLDEVVGMWISLLLVPKEPLFIIVAFIIWRALDIIKPYPANRIEKLKGGAGIMLDDVVSGIYTFLIMQIFVYLVK